MTIKKLHVGALHYAKPLYEEDVPSFVLWLDYTLEGSRNETKAVVSIPFDADLTYDQIIDRCLDKMLKDLQSASETKLDTLKSAGMDDRTPGHTLFTSDH